MRHSKTISPIFFILSAITLFVALGMAFILLSGMQGEPWRGIGERLDIVFLCTSAFFITETVLRVFVSKRPFREVVLIPAIETLAIVALNSALVLSESSLQLYARIALIILYFAVVVTRWSEAYELMVRSGMTPAHIIFLLFGAAIVVCALCLMLPYATVPQGSMPFIDALFTSVSAVCITGLTVVNTPEYFTFFGKCIILIFLQLGGLGFMTLSVVFAFLIGRRISVRERMRALEAFDQKNLPGLYRLVRVIVLTTLVIECIGAVVLFFSMRTGNLFEDAFAAVFHAVNGFCNAGFVLTEHNLLDYRGDTVVTLSFATLIILGGIGYTVLQNMGALFSNGLYAITHKGVKKRVVRMTAQTKIALLTTTFLIVFGTLFIFFNEYRGAIAHLPLKEKILVSFFQSVAPRTAGIETFSIGAMSEPTQYLAMLFMFIGGSPGGTAGGIKTTTFFLMCYSVISIMRGQRQLRIAKRTVPSILMNRALAIVALAVFVWIIGTYLVYLFERGSGVSAFALMYETLSALTTTGLSLGITAFLRPISKIILVLLMFIGRVGFLTVALGLVRGDENTLVDYPEETIMVG